ncbi:MAG: thioredoxin family protein [Sphingobacteriia bacterium 24-36-13]|jgi:bacillithiol system protein YtxJ|uniref:bacillithiol system redox-active protein YtxJ n=1 Tax=Sediminibacterium sp. TaxID=1917865 RepID=UPI000BDDDA83|nr:bacillithiol system redox-active protein YtxJ [Sediminibacterium sp.]OYY11873.1 MAG: thioredoxin family protein [Sphingobacteriia bacterium 35-36-14]OYZ53753.1 MAG: thioredoxin family protein [Sphingobacteriia bacterium 24-36-13]OZA63208.1 MAG: thioredoxin family protein [Sphingobacteriia bacterium 39-36-14]MBT9483253.1 bacillithiol system redox-active protein YtxJ [Sediminibacterium sp.]HQS24480.1 bacillithiol system redox-active protein YtxJ [Sediminibacterium sp.]
MNWIPLTEIAQLDQISKTSFDTPQVIFKHSTRCSISSMALNRLERETPPSNADFHFLDLIKNRNISNAIAEKFSVYHESPQILVIKNGECIYDESHQGISMMEIAEQVA